MKSLPEILLPETTRFVSSEEFQVKLVHRS